MLETYSLAFIPNDTIVTKVKQMKEQLAQEIGWFHSKNALAHITVCEFKSDASAIAQLQLQLTNIAKTTLPVSVTLATFGTYPNGAFFLCPTLDSKENLKPIMKSFTSRLKVKDMYKSNDPHVSIARKLNTNQISIAEQLFVPETLSFLCQSIALRKLDLQKKQFEIIATFPFTGEVQPAVQTSLF
ncbi:2'-5' RNA ligase family protein [Flavobacterium sp. J27]|uniref:2'-5' RNA ligase family protein n=1 Tax=Flavobacterium sp. J27 TaxID=2060419 RepID=UPI0010309EE9|nr:2'-5' RNA ligase family protein [Flavobacterium sp. J27]